MVRVDPDKDLAFVAKVLLSEWDCLVIAFDRTFFAIDINGLAAL